MNPETLSDRKALVVYYSLSGFTKRVGDEIAHALPCATDLEEIEEAKERRGWLGYVRSCYEVMRKKRPKIRVLDADVAAYDLVIVGTPVWASHMASPVRTFLFEHKDHFKEVAFFCTYGGSGEMKTLDEMVGLCETEPFAKLALTDGEITKDTYRDKIDGFITEIGERLSKLGGAKPPLPQPASTNG